MSHAVSALADLPIGVPSYLLVSLANLGPKMFNVTKINGIVSDVKTGKALSNFTRKMYGDPLGPREQRSFRYPFTPKKTLSPGEYRLTFSAFYNNRDKEPFSTVVYNETNVLVRLAFSAPPRGRARRPEAPRPDATPAPPARCPVRLRRASCPSSKSPWALAPCSRRRPPTPSSRPPWHPRPNPATRDLVRPRALAAARHVPRRAYTHPDRPCARSRRGVPVAAEERGHDGRLAQEEEGHPQEGVRRCRPPLPCCGPFRRC